MTAAAIPSADARVQLTAIEATAFDDLERVIEKGLATFVEVGTALSRIRDGKLYREGFATFEDYCRERWGLSRSYAYQQIDAAKIADSLSTIADTPAPASESVARELAPLKNEPAQLRETWEEAVKEHGEKPTAKQVRQVVDRRQEPAPTPAAAKTVEPSSQEDLHDECSPREWLEEEAPRMISDITVGLTSGWIISPVEVLVELIDEASDDGFDLSSVDLSDLLRARQALDEALDKIVNAVKGGGS